MSKRIWVYLGCTASLSAAIVASSSWRDHTLEHLPIFIVLLLLAAAVQLWMHHAPRQAGFCPSDIFFFAGALVLSPPLLLAVVLVPLLVEWGMSRWAKREQGNDWHEQTFTVATTVLAAFTAHNTFMLLNVSGDALHTPLAMLAAMTAAAVYVSITHAIVAVSRLVEGRPPLRVAELFGKETLIPAAVNTWLGYVFAVVWILGPWLVVPVLAPLLLLYRVLMVPTLRAEAEASRLQSSFLATISHEIRTPMNGIIGMTDMLFRTPLSDEQHRYANIVHSSAHTLLHLLNDVLDYTKLDAGKIDLEQIDLEPRVLLASTTDILRPKAREKRITLLTYVAPEVPNLVAGDPARVRQVLLNLIGNAIKFTEQGQVVVRVTGVESSSRGHLVRFAVIDTGIGLSETARARLFQPYAQADTSTTRRYGGTGLGLAISKHLVELMGGTLGVDSVEGQGSTFWFTIPFAIPTEQVVEERRIPPGIYGMRALIADTNATSREIARRWLTAWGARVDGAVSGVTVLAGLRWAAQNDEPYEVVLIDQHLSDMEGTELASAIRREFGPGQPRLVMLATWDEPGQASLAQSFGFDAYLAQPLTQDHLLAAITGTAVAPPAAPTTDTRSVSSVERRKRVLVADDNQINQHVAVVQLQKLGYEAVAVGDGIAAVEAVLGDRFDLVLMDCQMPRMDGFEATGQIRRRASGAPHVPIVAMTGNTMEGDREQCIAAGMDDYLTKPLDIKSLQSVLDHWTGDDVSEASDAATPLPLSALAQRLAARRDEEPQRVLPLRIAPSPPRSSTANNESALLRRLRSANTSGTTVGSSLLTIDPQRLERLRALQTPDDPTFMQRLCEGFLRDTPTIFEDMRHAMEMGDADGVRKAAHKCKGSCANFGAQRLEALCYELEKMGRNGMLHGAQATLQQIEAEWSQVRAALIVEQHIAA